MKEPRVRLAQRPTHRLPIVQHRGLTPLLRVGYQPRPGRRRLE